MLTLQEIQAAARAIQADIRVDRAMAKADVAYQEHEEASRAFCDACAEGSIPPGVAERLGKAREAAQSALKAFNDAATERSRIYQHIKDRTGLVATKMLSIHLEGIGHEGSA